MIKTPPRIGDFLDDELFGDAPPRQERTQATTATHSAIDHPAHRRHHPKGTIMNTTDSIETITIEGLATIKMKDGTEIQTTRTISLQVDMNGPGSSQVSSLLKVPGLEWQAEPHGLVDSEHPVVRQFFDRVMEIIASPERKCYDVPARAAVQTAD